MKKATISVAKNTLSSLIDAVKRGESILILDRDTPVARLEPVGQDPSLSSVRMADLVKRGAVLPPRKTLDVAAFLGRSVVSLSPGASGVRTVLEERRKGQ